MTPEGFTLAATIILLGPMLYFLVTSLTFLLRPLSDPVVTWLLRGLFNVHFLLVSATCALAAMAFLLASRPLVAIGIGAVAALAIAVRHWFLSRIDRELRVRDAGDATAVARLRRLHWGGMLYNAVQFAAVVANISRIFPAGV